MTRALGVGSLAVAVVGIAAVTLTGADKPSAKPDPAAVERARDTVKLLDNVYKNAVVLITETYVHDEDDFPAGAAAVELFQRTSKDGSHKVRIIDVTGMPYDDENVAADDFEKEAVKQLQAGEAYYDRVEMHEGKPQLRAATAIPVVLEKCVMCHPHYKDVKEGAAIGALTYVLPIR